MFPLQWRKLFDGVQDAGQRLQSDRVRGAQRRVVRCQPVAVGGDVLHQPVEAGGPTDHPVSDPVVGVRGRDHLADDFMDWEARHLRGQRAGVAGQAALDTLEAGQVASADAGGEELHQDTSGTQCVGGRVGQCDPLERVWRDEAITPHPSALRRSGR
jgi:hypothetical protein